MICYSISLLKILPNKADHVVRALRHDGLLAELKKQIPGHIGCSVLESDLTNDLHLVIDFWRSKYDFFESETSPSSIFLAGVLDRMAYQHSILGPFSFPPPPDVLSDMSLDQEMDSESEVLHQVETLELVRGQPGRAEQNNSYGQAGGIEISNQLLPWSFSEMSLAEMGEVLVQLHRLHPGSRLEADS
jgi:hypothetical protein